jgi:hypothetical protein
LYLLFSSDGRTAQRESLELYYSISKDGDSWSVPKPLDRLSPETKSSANNAFPCLTSGHDVLYFSSDRDGGCGGYDLYAAPFHFPVSRVKGIVRDSITGIPIVSEATIAFADGVTKSRIADIHSTPPSSSFDQEVESGPIRITARAKGYYASAPLDITIGPDEEQSHDLYLVPEPIGDTIATIDIQSATIPFFVTGYYRLNVPEQLRELQTKLDGSLSSAGYIRRKEAFSDEYLRYGMQVEKLFADSIIAPLQQRVFPKFRPAPGDVLEIRITGYADPRDLSAGSRYLEGTAIFQEPGGGTTRIAKGDRIDNRVLSQLRAYYAMEYFDTKLQSHVPQYRVWRDKGVIRYSIQGGGVDVSDLQYAARRRVQVLVTWHRATGQ